MEIVFLAAGVGRRMGSHVEGLPKVLFPLRGRTILETNLERFLEVNPRPGVVLVTGYRGELVEVVAERYATRLSVRAVRNADFATRGPAISAQLGLRTIPEGRGIAIANGDTVFSQDILRGACSDTWPIAPVLFASRTAAPDVDDVRVRTDGESGRALEAAKAVPAEHTAGISAGLLVARDAVSEGVVRRAVDRLVSREATEGTPLHWHNVIAICAQAGYPPHVVWVPREQWQEFDAPADIQSYNNRIDSVRSEDEAERAADPAGSAEHACRRMR